MRRGLVFLAVALVAVVFVGQARAFEIEITVSPNVINIQSEATVVTVHTDIAYGAVAGATVELNGIAIAWSKADARGNFVAKFVAEEVKDLVKDGQLDLGTVTLTLTGETRLGVTFSGSDDVEIIDVIPKKR